MNSPARYIRNIQGFKVELVLLEVDPSELKLDPSNPRIRYSMQQLLPEERNEHACEVMLVTQEETEALKKSIIRSGGVQEPIYLRTDMRVAEGNRRVVALRGAKKEFPGDSRFTTMPAWQIPPETPEYVIQDLLNEIHIGSVRGWAPYEKAMQMRGLSCDAGLIEEEIAERYRMTAREVRQHISAVEMMERLFFPIVEDPTDPDHRSKYSYFLEFVKNRRIQAKLQQEADIAPKFSQWVRDGRLDKGAQVRQLSKILASPQSVNLLNTIGFDAAKQYLAKINPEEDDLYASVLLLNNRLDAMTISEVEELKKSTQRQDIFRNLQERLLGIMTTAGISL